MAKGPLSGYRVLEMAGIGPGPMCAMLLADLGADVLRVDRVQSADLGIGQPPKYNLLTRGRPSVAVDLKHADGIETVLALVENADALIEGFRPGVMERLGLGPDICLGRNPKLVYGRMTGWGQDGPLAKAAGHDLNYIALTGALHAIGPKGGPPIPPMNLIGDFGGGAIYLAFGVVCGLLESVKSGQGQVIDAAMTDGAASLMTAIYGLQAMGMWSGDRGENILDGGAHFYGVYETKDNQYVTIGSIEPKFYAELLERIGLDGESLPDQMSREDWPSLRQRLEAVFKTKSRDEWCDALEGTDICFAPVLSMAEAPEHAHNKARGTFVEVGGVAQPGPAPRFSRTPGEVQMAPVAAGSNSREALSAWGFDGTQIDHLINSGVVAQAQKSAEN